MPKGTVVEVIVEDDDGNKRTAHGVIERFDNGAHIVCYIEQDEDGVWGLEEHEYVVPVEAINDYALIGEGGKRAAWQHMGYVYRSRHEILPADEVNSDESDEEWVEGNSDEDDENEDESDDDEVGATDEEEEEEEDAEDAEDDMCD
eukprot:3315287-Pleurochrysis_carterae.AAC.1